jgi:cytidylate kinase
MIYVITGLMASGKSTVAELLAREFTRSVHLRGDLYRRMIVCGRKEMSEAPGEEALRQLDLRYRLATQAAKEY